MVTETVALPATTVEDRGIETKVRFGGPARHDQFSGLEGRADAEGRTRDDGCYRAAGTVFHADVVNWPDGRAAVGSHQCDLSIAFAAYSPQFFKAFIVASAVYVVSVLLIIAGVVIYFVVLPPK